MLRRIVFVIALGIVFLNLVKTVFADEKKLYFLKPQDGEVVKSGTTILIEIMTEGLEATVVTIKEGFFETPMGKSGKYTFQYKIPLDTAGEVKLEAIGASSAKEVIEAVEKIIVKPDIEKLKLKIKKLWSEPHWIHLKKGETIQLLVWGYPREDDPEGSRAYDIVSTEFGTEYVLYPGKPPHTEIIRVDNWGKVTAVHPGVIDLVIGYGLTKAVSVHFVVE